MQDVNITVSQLLQGSTQVQQGLEKLDASIQGGSYQSEETTMIISKENSLVSSIQAYIHGVTQIHDGLATLSDASQTLLSGSSQLSNGITQFAQQTPNLIQRYKSWQMKQVVYIVVLLNWYKIILIL